MATPNYDVNYDDKRFTQVESDKKEALSEIETTYNGMIKDSDKYYQAQIDNAKAWAERQSQLQQEQTDFAIEKIEHQKTQAKKDYIKEQSGAYVDWQKQSNQYGANAEQMAASGLANSGFSESSQVSMYNTYQNRITAARESYNQAVLNYDNAIKDAQLQNNSILAEIANKTLEKQLELSLQGFQYKNTLLLEKANKKTEAEDRYYGRYQDVLNQINTENSLAEQVRQYNETLAENQRQYNQSYALQQEELQFKKDQFAYQKEQDAKSSVTSSKGSSGGGTTSKKDSSTKGYEKAEKMDQQNEAKKKKEQKTASAYEYLNKLIASGADKSKVSNEIALALRNGEITKAEAKKLRSIFTPRGVAY